MSSTGSKSRVYFLSWEARDRLPELLDVSGAASVIKPSDLVAVKMHFGEKGNDGYIKPEYVRSVLKMIRREKAGPFLTDTGAIYRGQRNNAAGHLELAAEHGFSQTRLNAPVVIADGLLGNDFEVVRINGTHFKEVKIASAIYHADSIIVLTHFKGHLLAGFGGAIKNLGMGCGSRTGKFEMHSSVAPAISSDLCEGCGVCVARCAQGALEIIDGKVSLDPAKCAGCGECVAVCGFKALSVTWSEGPLQVQERFAEYAAGAVLGKRVFYLNFVNHVTPNCDCLSKGEKSLVPDLGILASKDPLAIDKASVDIVLEAGGDVFAKAHPGVDWRAQLIHAERMGLGSIDYELVRI